jgi:hypothetical protein
MPDARTFHVGDLLSVADGRLLSPRGYAGFMDFLCYMSGRPLFTHEVPSAISRCRPFLLAQHPRLGDPAMLAELRRLDEIQAGPGGKPAVLAWIADQAARLGEHLAVEPVPPGEDGVPDPVEELVRQMGPDRVLAIDGD